MKLTKWRVLREKVRKERKIRNMKLWLKSFAVSGVCAAYILIVLLGLTMGNIPSEYFVILGIAFTVLVIVVKRYLYPGLA